MTSTQLLDLPTELLHEICIEFDTGALVCLSQVCHGLLQITQAIIWKRHIPHLQALVDLGHLIIKPGKAMNNITGREFSPLNSVELKLADFSTFAETLHSCYGLLSRVDCVGHFEFQLALNPPWQHIRAPRWDQLAAVMNAVAEKPNSTLRVSGGNWNTGGRPFAYTITSKPPALFTSRPGAPIQNTRTSFPVVRQFIQLLESVRAIFKTPVTHSQEIAKVDEAVIHIVQELKTSSLELPLSSLPLLQTFHIHSRVLLHLPFFSWTMDTLNRAPITSLSFKGIDLVHQDWGTILQSITIPTLLELSLGSSQVAFPDLQLFLERHPTITTLDLTEGVAIGPLVPYSSEKLLPRLVQLAGNPEYLAHFLQPVKAYPELNLIMMDSELGLIHHEYQYSQFEKVFQLIPQRKRSISLCLLLRSTPGLLPWLLSCKSRPIENVTRLELRTGDIFVNSTPIQHAICDWLKVFPSILHLACTNPFRPILEAGFVGPIFWDRFPHLETIDLGGTICTRP